MVEITRCNCGQVSASMYIGDGRNMVDLFFSIYDLEYFLLIFVRVSCFVYIAPYFRDE